MDDNNPGCFSWIIGIIVVIAFIKILLTVYFFEVITVGIVTLAILLSFKYYDKIYIPKKRKQEDAKLKAEQESQKKEIEEERTKELNRVVVCKNEIESALSSAIEVVQKYNKISTFAKKQNYDTNVTLEERYIYLQNYESNLEKIFKRKIQDHLSLTVAENIGTKDILDILDFLDELTFNNFEKYQTQFYCKDRNEMMVENDIFLRNNIDIENIYKNYKKTKNESVNSLNSLFKELKNEHFGISVGISGERAVQTALELYDDIFTCFYGTCLIVDGEHIENDAIVICSKGLFSIEVKNYGSTGSFDLKVTKDGQWLKLIGSKSIPFDDVVKQSNRHIGLKQKFVNRKLKEMGHTDLPYIYAEPIIVMANDTIRVTNESETPIMRASQIYSYIKSKPDILTPETIKDIEKILKEGEVPSKKYKHQDFYSEFEDILEDFFQMISYYIRVGFLHNKYCETLLDKKLIDENLFKKITYKNLNKVPQALNKDDLEKLYQLSD